jgi:RNA recognition motif-containing protein
VNDRETGQPRGFAFVEMANDEDAAKAMTGLNGKEVAGRALRVNEATAKPERGGPRANTGFAPRNGSGGKRPGGGGGSRGRGGFSTEDYSGSARQPREPRW